MKILFLDDNEGRFRKFKARTIGCIVDHALSIDSAIQFLNTFTYDYVFLDFDLENYPLMNNGRNGMEVVDFIIANKDNYNIATTRFIVHSLNHIGGTQMYAKLRLEGFRVEHIPGVYDFIRWENDRLIMKRWTIEENE
jgi:hypothetical protein